MKKIRVGIVGCGAIGKSIALAIDKKLKNKYKLIAVCDTEAEKAHELAALLKSRVRILSLGRLIKHVDLVVESASANISGPLARKSLLAGKDILVMSVGGLIADAKSIFTIANRKKSHLFIPSGALAGLDAVKGASGSRIDRVILTTRKPPKSLSGAPFILKKGIDLAKIKKETVIFKGSAQDAIKYFPQNINVAAALSLCGIGPKKTKVNIITSPLFTKNSHEVCVEGDFGRIVTRTENIASFENPKTSYLAMLSAISTLKGIADYVKIGT